MLGLADPAVIADKGARDLKTGLYTYCRKEYL